MNTDQIISEHFVRTHIKDAVQIIEGLEYDDIVAFISELPLDLATSVFLQMNNYQAAKCLESLDLKIAIDLLVSLELVSADLLLRHCDEGFRNKLLDSAPPNIASKIRQRLRYAVNSVGKFMKLKVFSLHKDASVGEAVALMKKERALITSEIFVTDERTRFEGIVNMTDIVLAESTDQISSILTTDIPRFFADDPIQRTKEHPAWGKYRMLPVIDHSEILIGSLLFSDINEIDKIEDNEVAKQMLETGTAVGELYWIGLSGLLQSISRSD